MTRRIVLRLLGIVAVVIATVSAAFVLVIALPADPARTLVGPHATPETLARVRAHYCLDRGVVTRYGCFVGRLARGDLGRSLRSRRAVSSIIADRAAATAQLAVAALALQLALAVPLAIGAARRRDRWSGSIIEGAITIAQSTPAFVLGPLLLYLVGFRLGWLPLGGQGSGAIDRLRHLALPAITLAVTGLAAQVRVLRDELVVTLASDHVRAARARGLSERAVVWRHALRPALAPFVTLAGLDLGALLGGAIVVESVFAWPGLGRETMLAVADLDLPVILGITLVAAIAVSVANLAVDLINARLDPRSRDP